MKRIFVAFILLFFVGCSSVSADEAPVRIKVEYRQTKNFYGQLIYYPNLIITSIQDAVVINKITANRGNCQGFMNPKLPLELKYGKSIGYSFTASSCPEILEIEVDTNFGSWTFSMDN